MELQVYSPRMGQQLICDAIMKAVTSLEEPDGVILIHGASKTKLQRIVEDATEHRNLGVPLIVKLTAVWAERILATASAHIRPTCLLVELHHEMAARLKKNRVSPRVMIHLENWSPALVLDYLQSGLVDFYKTKGIHIKTVAWSVEFDLKMFGERFVSKISMPGEVEMGIVLQDTTHNSTATAPPQPQESVGQFENPLLKSGSTPLAWLRLNSTATNVEKESKPDVGNPEQRAAEMVVVPMNRRLPQGQGDHGRAPRRRIINDIVLFLLIFMFLAFVFGLLVIIILGISGVNVD